MMLPTATPPGVEQRAEEAAPSVRGVLHGHEHGPLYSPADGEALHDPQRDQQDRGGTPIARRWAAGR